MVKGTDVVGRVLSTGDPCGVKGTGVVGRILSTGDPSGVKGTDVVVVSIDMRALRRLGWTVGGEINTYDFVN